MFGCTVCPRGTNTCPRCNTSLCNEHVPFAREACAECELQYHDEREEIRFGSWFAAGFALPWAGLLAISDALPSWSARSGGYRAITTGVPMIDILLMTLVIAVFAGKAAMGIRSAVHRRQFMAPARVTPSVPVAVATRMSPVSHRE
jgi:hypothetical protein